MSIPNANLLKCTRNSCLFPGWLSNKSVLLYIVVLLIVFVLWQDFFMPINFFIVSALSLVSFFVGGRILSVLWKYVSPKQYIKKIFLVAFIVRLIWVTYVYYFNISYFGAPIGDTADTEFYVDIGNEFASALSNFDFSCFEIWINIYKISIDDLGYPLYLGILYYITLGVSDVYIPFLLKSVLGAYTCVLIFKISNDHFGYNIAKLAGLLCVLNPNMIWWCGSMMKETEMVFFSALFIKVCDNTINYKNYNFVNLFVTTLLGMYVFMYRSALGAVAFISILVATLLMDKKVVSMKQKISYTVAVVAFLVIGMGNVIVSRTQDMYENVKSGGQEVNMEWRTNRVGGNSFAKYAGATVFAPLILTIPFPTFVSANSNQYSQMQMSGGNFIKNILSFFCILFIAELILNGKWNKHVLPLSFMLGYLIVLVMSGYAQSGRFHMPVWPLEMMFAACGICTLQRKQIKLFDYVLVLEFIACVSWQWFKLKGRGLI